MPAKFIERFQNIDELIARKATGTPVQFAEKLDIIESTLYEFLKVLKEQGAPVEYDQERRSYIYLEKGRLEIKFKRE